MSRRRASFVFAAAILLGIAALYFLRRPEITPESKTSPRPLPIASAAGRPETRNSESKAESSEAGRGANPLAAELNAPAGTIRRDLEVLNELFVNFQTNFPRTGNPVGENSEITAALTGNNPAHFAFVPPTHRAINARGELCDRWGTPFRFHQISGTVMEIRSAGPDRKFGTTDDAEFSPASPTPVPR